MDNPFKDNKDITTGFYFDKSKKLICYVFVDEGDEMTYPSTEIYNRFTNIDQMYSIFKPRDPNESKVINLVNLELDLLLKHNTLEEDFKWIHKNYNVSKEFVNFLLKEEKYLILELFKTFFNTKIKTLDGTNNI